MLSNSEAQHRKDSSHEHDYSRGEFHADQQSLMDSASILISEAQSELTRLETQKNLLNAAQQQLIQQLKPLYQIP